MSDSQRHPLIEGKTEVRLLQYRTGQMSEDSLLGIVRGLDVSYRNEGLRGWLVWGPELFKVDLILRGGAVS